MRVLTYTSYKEHCELYTEIHGSIAINSCQIELAQKYIILLSEISIIVYEAGKRTGVENTEFIHFNLSAGTYSIDGFNAKIKVAILQQRQDWQPPQIKDPRLVIPEDYTFIAPNTIFISLGIQDNYLEKTTLIRSTLLPGSYKTSLDTSPLHDHCRYTANKSTKLKTSWMVNHQVCWPPCMFLIIKQPFSRIHLVFL